jgi:hypothetical protein
MGLPQIKKKISSFINDEEGKISKQSLFALGTFIGSAAIASVLSSKNTAANDISLTNSTVGNTITATASHTHHGSHSSHGSHGSHGSHSSHGSHNHCCVDQCMSCVASWG